MFNNRDAHLYHRRDGQAPKRQDVDLLKPHDLSSRNLDCPAHEELLR
jgi:hypothetical protein